MLVVRPLRLLQVSDPAWKLLLIIDGVDECYSAKSQTNLICTMAKLLSGKDLPIIVLFSSRCENQIQMAFNPRDTTGILFQLPLDDNYHAEDDILRFLNDSFDNLKHVHPFRKSLGAEWPLPDHVQEIVVKSSGQFIYASVAVNFISDPAASPSARLDIIRGLRPTGRLTPFAELDALYRQIFSQVDDIAQTLECLAYRILARNKNLQHIMYFFEYEAVDVQSILAPLASVLFCDVDGNEITLLHASVADFLCDKARSGAYCINALATPLCIHWFKTAKAGRFKDLRYGQQFCMPFKMISDIAYS